MNQIRKLSDGERDELVRLGSSIIVPAIVAAAGEDAQFHFVNFFISNIRNPNTRRAYARHARNFCAFIEARGVADIRQVQSPHVAAYLEARNRDGDSVTNVKQSLSAIRMLFDWLVVNQVLPMNPSAAVRGPKLVVTEGLTPICDDDEVVELLERIPTGNIVGLRDRALIGVMAYTLARIGAVISLRVRDYYIQGRSSTLRLAEKGGRRNIIAVHHVLEEYLDEYIEAAGIGDQKNTPLFRAALGNTKMLSENPLQQTHAWRMVNRRARQAGIATKLSNHTFRATGITNYLSNGGSLEAAQKMAGHADPRTTRLYDRRRQLVTRSEVERIRYERKV